MKRKIALSVMAAVFFFLFITHAASSGRDGFKEKGRIPGLAPDIIVLITIDTLRADHLGCYGYPVNVSPFIDELARGGVLFKKHVASAPLTATAHATIFTSLYPLQHGVLKNGAKLDDSYLTMAEAVGKAGYETAGFAGTVIHFKTGNMDQGFDFFDEPERNREIIKRPIQPVGKRIKRAVKTRQDVRKRRYRQADKTIDKAINWLKTRRSGGKLFLWIHLFDPHKPYIAPSKYQDRMKNLSEKEKKALAAFLYDEQGVNFQAFDKFKKNDEPPEMIGSYDAEISFVDGEIKRLYRYFLENGLNQNALWIITADHGEGLGNHKFIGHVKNIYNEQVHVPLIFHFTSGTGNGRVAEQVIEQVDILPTIAELTGADVNGQVIPVEGVSFAPLIAEKRGGFFEKPALSYKRQREEVGNSGTGRKKRKILEPKTGRRQAGTPVKKRRELSESEKKDFTMEKFAIQDNQYKYIFNTQKEDEFYSMATDPFETNNMIGKGLKEEAVYREALMSEVRRLKQSARSNSRREPLDMETIKRLKSLGYMQ